MLRATRLEKLEADTLTAWRAACEQSEVIFDKHLQGISTDTPELLQRLEVERPDLSSDEAEREGRAFLESLGITQFAELAKWFKSYEPPDLDADRPDLSMWPSDIPTPPDELPGQWTLAEAFVDSDELIERLAAQVFCFLLATARATRDERTRGFSGSS